MTPVFLEHCSLLYSGKEFVPNNNLYGGAIILGDASPTIANCSFQHNLINGIEIPGGTKNPSVGIDKEVWHNTDVVYTVSGDLAIAEGMKLVLDPGITVKFKPNTRITVQGALDARGTPTETITFTSFNDDAHGGDTDDDGTATSPAKYDWGLDRVLPIVVMMTPVFLEHCSLLYSGKEFVSQQQSLRRRNHPG